MTTSPSRAGALAAAVALLAACAPAQMPASPETPRAEARSDTAAVATARRVLGSDVHRAVTIHPDEKTFIVALRDAVGEGLDPVDPNGSVSRYAYEVVVLERSGAEWTITAPGLYAFDEQDHARRARVDGDAPAPGLGSPRDPELLWGMADVDDDGDEEPWAAMVMSGATAFSIDLRAFDPVTRERYRFQAPSGDRTGRLDHAQAEVSPNSALRPAVRRWLAARADTVVAAWIAATLAEG